MEGGQTVESRSGGSAGHNVLHFASPSGDRVLVDDGLYVADPYSVGTSELGSDQVETSQPILYSVRSAGESVAAVADEIAPGTEIQELPGGLSVVGSPLEALQVARERGVRQEGGLGRKVLAAAAGVALAVGGAAAFLGGTPAYAQDTSNADLGTLPPEAIAKMASMPTIAQELVRAKQVLNQIAPGGSNNVHGVNLTVDRTGQFVGKVVGRDGGPQDHLAFSVYPDFTGSSDPANSPFGILLTRNSGLSDLTGNTTVSVAGYELTNVPGDNNRVAGGSAASLRDKVALFPGAYSNLAVDLGSFMQESLQLRDTANQHIDYGAAILPWGNDMLLYVMPRTANGYEGGLAIKVDNILYSGLPSASGWLMPTSADATLLPDCVGGETVCTDPNVTGRAYFFPPANASVALSDPAVVQLARLNATSGIYDADLNFQGGNEQTELLKYAAWKASTATAPCVRDTYTACIGPNGLFEVRADWQITNNGGASGAGIAIYFPGAALIYPNGQEHEFPIDATAAFNFFGNLQYPPTPSSERTLSNIELFVKGLNACASPNFNRDWFAASGLTGSNVAADIFVRHTGTGMTSTYRKPFVDGWPNIFDGTTFTCPE